MMLRLLAVSLSLIALGSAQGPSVQLGDHPLFITMIRYVNQTLPCSGPCVLDNLDYIIDEVGRGPRSDNAQCVDTFVRDVQNSFPPAPPGINPDQHFTTQWLQALARPNNICPKLDRVVSCFARSSANVCGRSSQVETERVLNSLLTFLDCNIPSSRQLRLFECVYPVMSIFNPLPPPGYNTFTTCIAPSLNYFNQGYETVYRDIISNFGGFGEFESAVRNLLTCYIQWDPSSMLTSGRCDNAVAHINKQLDSMLFWLRDGEGRSMFTCLGDQRLYQNPAFERCINTFTTNGGDLIRRVNDAISTGNMVNIKQLLRELAVDTCRTRAVPDLIECLETVLVSNPNRRCNEVVIPTARHLYMPTLQYMYLLGGCSGRIGGGALQSRVCQCARYIPDYSFRPEVSSQCLMDQTRSYTINFYIINYQNTPYEFSQLKADLQPKIDAIYRRIFGDQFLASENYRFRLNEFCLDVTIDLLFYQSVNTNSERLVSYLPEEIVGITTGYVYEVRNECILEPEAVVLSLQMTIIVVVVGVVAVTLVILLLVYCCCPRPRGSNSRVRQEKTVVHVPDTNYMYPGVHPGLCVQQTQVMSPYGQCVHQAPVMSPYGQCSCQSPPTKTILQFQ